MSRHGSGKRRRTSPDPDDPGGARPEAGTTPGPVEDTFDAGAPGSGDYPAYGAEPYPPTDYAPTDYAPADYAPPAEPAYESGGYPAGSPTFEPDAYDSGDHRAADYAGASAYDPATDPALGAPTTHTAQFAAVADPPESSPADPEPPASDTGMRPPPPPHEGDIIKLVSVGSLIWFALFVLAWFMRDSLADDGRDWWPWCALAGSGLGLFGLWYCRRLQSAQDD
ncbi:hypothetical protein [Embleya sp. AB8]|uniref:hypothetical protein n=1 Tax=Embleya sp. AB8 TaxID=3156304 RepID=UPI003C7291A5